MILHEESILYRSDQLNGDLRSFTDVQLISVLFGNEDDPKVQEAARKILKEGGLDNIRTLNPESLIHLPPRRKLKIQVLAELSNRISRIELGTEPQITSIAGAYKLLSPLLSHLQHEEFWILILNRCNRVIAKQQISKGGFAGTFVDPKIIFREALLKSASSIILAHNHPSGNLEPSKADLQITQKLKKAGEFMDIQILDHLIISKLGFYSFANEGVL